LGAKPITIPWTYLTMPSLLLMIAHIHKHENKLEYKPKSDKKTSFEG
jgi:hypothetical protein